jgi:hypothetical protein
LSRGRGGGLGIKKEKEGEKKYLEMNKRKKEDGINMKILIVKYFFQNLYYNNPREILKNINLNHT